MTGWSTAARGWARATLMGRLAVCLAVAAPASMASADDAALSATLLTLDRAAELARTQGFAVLEAEAAEKGAEADIAQSGQTPNPQMQAWAGPLFNYSTTGCPPGECSLLSLQGQLTDGGALVDMLSGKRGVRREVTTALAEAVRHDRDSARRLLELSAKRQYVATVVSFLQMRLTEEVVAAFARLTELHQIRLKAGAISEADIAKLVTERLNYEQSAERVRETYLQNLAGLIFLIGDRDPNTRYELSAALPSDERSAAASLPEIETLVERALARRPEFLAADARVKAGRAGEEAALKLRTPDIELGLMYQSQGWGQSAASPPALMVGLSLPIPLFNYYRGELAQAEARTLQAEAARSRLRGQLVSDIRNAYAWLGSARRRVARNGELLLAVAAKTRDLTRLQYEKGAASLLELLDAERTWLEVNRAALDDVNDLWAAWYSLELAVGESL